MAKIIAERTLVRKVIEQESNLGYKHESIFADSQGNRYTYTQILLNSKRFSIEGTADETLDERGRKEKARLNRRSNGTVGKQTAQVNAMYQVLYS